MYSIIITPAFEKTLRNYLKGNPDDKQKIIKSLSELIIDPDHPSLRTHKLEDKNDWSLSLDMSNRITFEIIDDHITLLNIGSHETVYI